MFKEEDDDDDDEIILARTPWRIYKLVKGIFIVRRPPPTESWKRKRYLERADYIDRKIAEIEQEDRDIKLLVIEEMNG